MSNSLCHCKWIIYAVTHACFISPIVGESAPVCASVIHCPTCRRPRLLSCLSSILMSCYSDVHCSAVPTLPHLNPFLVVLSGHRSALQRTLDLLGENKRDDSLVKKRRERAYLVSADCRADSPPCSRVCWDPKEDGVDEEGEEDDGGEEDEKGLGNHRISGVAENTWYSEPPLVRDQSAIKDDAKLERCFDLEDLLRASAEVLGKGSVGTSYKAVLEEGTTVVVKRLKDVVVTKREFEVQLEVEEGQP
ncbi:hypothetical protein Syun_021633 [Stephania yunnanensis]|uniref:Protein kinase domain-containing protein n=1 Tax=Stephania yunnanensis TaxID=152371 RepID=A0AAP0NSG0_9MAGN